jgi:hypothetical protein
MKPAKSDISMKVWPTSDLSPAQRMMNRLLRDASHQFCTVIATIIVGSVVLHITTYSIASLEDSSATSMPTSNHLRSLVPFIDGTPAREKYRRKKRLIVRSEEGYERFQTGSP